MVCSPCKGDGSRGHAFFMSLILFSMHGWGTVDVGGNGHLL